MGKREKFFLFFLKKLLTSPSVYGIIKTVKRGSQKKKGRKKIMATYTITEQWFNEIKNEVPHANPFTYKEEGWHDNKVELDILDEDLFIAVSTEKGWM